MDYRLKKIYEQMLMETPCENILSQNNLCKVYESLLIERAVSSKAVLSAAIAKADSRISVRPTSKDIRIQPINEFTIQDLYNLFEKLKLKLISALKPGEEGSTSMQLITYIVEDSVGNRYSIVLGKGKGFGVRDENKAIEDINQQISNLLSTENRQYIVLEINGKSEKINGVRSTPGTPKSDFEFTFDGQPKIFISHKAGTTAFDYQQYGGTTCSSGKNVCSHPEVEDFVKAIKAKFPLEMPPKTSVYRKIKDDNLKKIALFGMDYGKDFGINNVNALLQGNLQLVPTSTPNVYTITAKHVVYNGDLPTSLYEPILYGRFSASRGGNHGIKNLRTAILPVAKISKSTQQI